MRGSMFVTKLPTYEKDSYQWNLLYGQDHIKLAWPYPSQQGFLQHMHQPCVKSYLICFHGRILNSVPILNYYDWAWSVSRIDWKRKVD